jgi:ABC-type multidrug transport system fused ATPase/permease subunit
MSVREAIRASLGLLTPRDRRLLLVAMALQVLSSALDLVGVLLLGLVGALAVTTIQSSPPPQVVVSIAEFFGLEDLSDQALVGVFAGTAALVLLGKSAISSILTRRVFIFLANRQALVSARLAAALLSRPLTFLQLRSSQETAYALIQGAGAATVSILGQLVVVVTETALLVVLAAALLVLDPAVTVGAIFFFLLVAVTLQRVMGSWASRLGRQGAEADIASLNTVQDAMSSYREITVLNRRANFVERFRTLRWESARVNADRTFILQVPKYVFEAALVVGGGVLAGVLFMTESSVAAVGTLALFLAAASRVMPSLLRLQSAALTMRDSASAARATFELAAQLDFWSCTEGSSTTPIEPLRADIGWRTSEPVPIHVRDLSFTYPGSQEPALMGVNLDVPAGSSLAVVGRSGAGKSTLADVLLGVLEPDTGGVHLGGYTPRALASIEPGLIAYVPQTIALVGGSVRDNVALGLPRGFASDDLIWFALERAHISELFRSLPTGLDSHVGENGLRLSGGQRQRLGIARAFLLSPTVLIMDEATSALDAESEAAITDLISSLHGSVTVVTIAHRLSTVKGADQVTYMEGGRLVATGKFDELCRRVPALARQVSLMRL